MMMVDIEIDGLKVFSGTRRIVNSGSQRGQSIEGTWHHANSKLGACLSRAGHEPGAPAGRKLAFEFKMKSYRGTEKKFAC